MAEEIKLGHEVKDRVTGFQGIVVSVTHFLNGCIRMGVQRKYNPKKDEKTTEPDIFDEPDLIFVSHGILPGPKPEPKPERRAPGHGNPGFRPTRSR